MDDGSRLPLISAVLLLFVAVFFAVAETAFASTTRTRMRVAEERGECDHTDYRANSDSRPISAEGCDEYAGSDQDSDNQPVCPQENLFEPFLCHIFRISDCAWSAESSTMSVTVWKLSSLYSDSRA